MKTITERKDKSLRRKSRVIFKISKNRNLYKLYVYRSNKHIYAQIVDNFGKTLLGVSSLNIKQPKDVKGKIDISLSTGKALAEKAKSKKIKEVIFNRGCYKYHGRIKALAEGAKEGGLKF
jgi:large subunit ribosomal protein L18